MRVYIICVFCCISFWYSLFISFGFDLGSFWDVISDKKLFVLNIFRCCDLLASRCPEDRSKRAPGGVLGRLGGVLACLGGVLCRCGLGLILLFVVF